VGQSENVEVMLVVPSFDFTHGEVDQRCRLFRTDDRNPNRGIARESCVAQKVPPELLLVNVPKANQWHWFTAHSPMGDRCPPNDARAEVDELLDIDFRDGDRTINRSASELGVSRRSLKGTV